MLVFGPGLLSTHGLRLVNTCQISDLTLSTVGEIHRRQRKLLNPVFSVANMRQTTPLFYETVYRVCYKVYFIRGCLNVFDDAQRSFAREFLIS